MNVVRGHDGGITGMEAAGTRVAPRKFNYVSRPSICKRARVCGSEMASGEPTSQDTGLQKDQEVGHCWKSPRV